MNYYNAGVRWQTHAWLDVLLRGLSGNPAAGFLRSMVIRYAAMDRRGRRR